MIGILYVFHGSQKVEKNQAAQKFIQQLQEQFRDEYKQQTAFLENHPDTITKQAREMIAQGVTKLIVVPVLLFAAKHALVDIPEELALVKEQYPKVSILQTETFGRKKGSRQVLFERFQTELTDYSADELIGFLVAHGSKRTSEPQEILTEIAAEIQQKVGFPIFATSLKGNENYLSVIKQNNSLDKQPVIVPFFLFDGHLTTNMQTELTQNFPETAFIITKTLEFDPRILIDLETIVKEAIVCIQSC
ncbi:sirohydrochlorin chelatase [Enterococcus sp. LJL99]